MYENIIAKYLVRKILLNLIQNNTIAYLASIFYSEFNKIQESFFHKLRLSLCLLTNIIIQTTGRTQNILVFNRSLTLAKFAATKALIIMPYIVQISHCFSCKFNFLILIEIRYEKNKIMINM